MIPDIIELNFPKIDGKQYATLTHASIPQADMGEKTITTQVKIDGEIVPDFSFDWEVEFQGEKYIMPLRIPQGAKENTSLDSTIDLTFQHWAIYQLKRWPFVTIQQIAAGTYLPDEEVAPVQLNLKDFCILFGQVLGYYYGNTITIDLNPAWQYKQEATRIEISHTKIWNVLIDAFHDKYGVRWEIKAAADNSNTVKGGERYVIRVGYPTTEVDHIFEYGFDGGLLKVERQVQSEEIRNMLKGRGGDTNIPRFYFKQVPDAEKEKYSYRNDPDWVEELANIPFTNLMPATFRSYVQGWKAAHISKYPGYTAVGESNAYAPWAYRKGYTDTKFHPVEFVADEISDVSEFSEESDGSDRRVEILPGYAPYIKKGSSIDKYGPLPDTLDNNDDIYPTLQGTGLDIAVDVEQIKSDDVAGATENDAVVSNIPDGACRTTATGVDKSAYATATLPRVYFTVETGKMANLTEDCRILSVTQQTKKGLETIDAAANAELVSKSVSVYDAVTGEKRSASGIPAGSYYFEITAEVHNLTTDKTLNITVGTETPKLESATPDDKWRKTFDIWVKNIWNSSKLSAETDAQYAERVWKPVLGDKEKNTAKVVFTSGALVHEDYEFTIVGFPVPDSSKTYEGQQSHWRITLAKSEAELEATGLYVPSTQKQGKAGDTFVFIGTEMTHEPYVVDAEERLDDWKKDQLGEVKEIKPTAVVTTDRVRLNNEGKPNALINQLRVGNSLRLFDKRFFNEEGKAYETLYLQSITYTYREPSSDDAALNPDVEIVLGTEYTTSANPVSMMQSEISALQRQVGAISNVEQIVRAVGDRLYLRKDGISDRSLSPTHFFSLLTSGDFRAGLIGGAGWGFYKDENGNWVLETDRLSVRQDMSVNTLVINQAEGRGGMEIDTAAYIDGVTRVEDTPEGYVCYFDQKGGSVANLFHVDDVAFCNRWTPENADLKFYRRRVTAVGADYITLSKTDVNGTGVPAEGDNIIHFGNYTDKTRQYIKVRDVVGGGYERYIEELNSVNAAGVEYYFVGKQAGKSRWFVGNKDLVPYSGKGDGSYIEYIDRKFNLHNVRLSITSSIVSETTDSEGNPIVTEKPLGNYFKELQQQIDGVVESYNGQGAPTLTNYPASGWTTDEERKRHNRDIYTDITPYIDDATTPTAGQSWRWYYNSETDYGWVKIADSDAVKALQMAKLSVLDSDVLFIQTNSETVEPALPTVNTDGAITNLNGWSTTAPAWKQGEYIWQCTYVRKGDGTTRFAGPTCLSGINGNGIDAVDEYYALNNSDSTPPTSWQKNPTKTPVPTATNRYLWNYEEVTYTLGNKFSTQPRVLSMYSEDGRAFLSSTDYYLATADGTNAPTGGWKTNFADAGFSATNRYLWNYEVSTYSKAPTSVASNPRIIGVWGAQGQQGLRGLQGPQGEQGIPGENGEDGKTSYFHIKYSAVANPTSSSQMTETPSTYIGTYVDYNAADSTDPKKYTWARFQGLQGADGSQGIPGENGEDGKTSYFHIKYSNDGGKTFTPATGGLAIGETPGDYIGQYTDFTQADSTDVTKYTWSKIKGDPGTSISITSTEVRYSTVHNSATQPADTTFTLTSVPTLTAGQYLWSRTKVTYSNTDSTVSYGVSRIGTNGADGTSITIKSTSVTYAKSTTSTQPADSAFTYASIGAAGVRPGEYLWTKTEIVYSDNTPVKTYSVSRIGSDGTTGEPGPAGADGRTPYVHWAYANSADGVTGFSTTYFNDALYVGRCTDYNAADPTSPSAYEWARLRGADGTDAKIVVVNSDATAFTYSNDFKTLVGPQSIALSATLQGTGGYQWSYKLPGQSAFTNISGATSATYSLAHNASIWGSGITNKAITLRCTSGGVHDEVTIVRVSSGANGTNGTSVTVRSTSVSYQASANGTTVPTGTWSTSVPSVAAGQYLWTKTVVNYSDGKSTTAYSVSRQGVNGADGEDGKDGTSVTIASTSITYYKGTSATQPADSAFTLTSIGTLTAGQYLWTKTEVKYSDGTITKGYSASYIGHDGSNGTPGTPGADGKTTYVHFAYGSSITGALPHPTAVGGFSTTPFAGAKYIGVCTDYNAADPTTNVGSTYEWSEYKGEDGADAYTVLLSNESHIFEGDTEKAVAASTTSEVIAYKGATQVPATIGSITGAPTGMTVAITNNGKTNAYFTVSVTTALTTKQGVLSVPVTVDGKQFTQKFSWSLSLRGKDGRGIVSVKEMYAVNNSSTIAPADSAFSTNIPQTSATNRYLWNMEVTTYTDNTSERTDKIVIGVHGANGEDGASITAVTNYYLASASATGVTASTAGWTTDASASAATMTDAKPYLWNYEEITYSKGNPTQTTPHVVGRLGRGVAKIEEEYYLSTSQTQLAGGEWKSEANKPAWQPGKFMWTRTKVTYTDGKTEYMGAVCVTGTPGTSVQAEYSADGSVWHPTFTAGDVWMRTSDDGGTTWSPAMRIVGEAGKDGQWRKFQWAKNNSATTAPTSGWQDTPLTAAAGEYVWMRSGIVVPPATAPAIWDTATRLTGDKGADGQSVYMLDIDNEVSGVICDATGAVTGAYPTSQASVYKGSTKLTSGVTYSIPQKTGISTVNITTAGAITMSGMSADKAEITVQAKVDGVTLTSVVSLYKVKPGANGQAAVAYSIEPSVGNITRSMTGVLSATSVTCSVYKTTGNTARVLTGDHTLTYQRLPDGATGTLTRTNGVSSAVSVLATTEAVIFELKNGSTLLDRERVPVLADASDLEISSRNLLINSKEFTIVGGANNYSFYNFKLPEGVKKGEYIALMVEGIENIAGAPTLYSCGCWDNNTSKNISGGTKTLSSTNRTAVFRITQDEDSPRFLLYAGQAGSTAGNTVKYTKAILVKGNISMQSWSPAPEDIENRVDTFDYLKEAMKGNTVVDGGLVMSSLMKLGTWSQATDPDKATMTKVYAGMNGIYANDRSIALWWGGDMVDRFNASDVMIKPEPANAAAALVRMNGTGYFAKGNIMWRADGSGSVAGGKLSWDASGNVTLGAGVTVAGGSGMSDTTLTSLLQFVNGINQLIVPVDASGNELPYNGLTNSDGTTKIKAIKAKFNFYSVGGVSALGMGGATGGGSGSGGGASALVDLLDVNISNLTKGQMLQYNGTHWANVSGIATEAYVNTRINNLINGAPAAYDTLKEIADVLQGNVNSIGDIMTALGNKADKSQLGDYVTLGTAQTISAVKTFTANILMTGTGDDGNMIRWNRNSDWGQIWFKNTADGDTDSYLGFQTGDNGNEYFRFSHKSSGATSDTVWATIKANGITAASFIKSGGTASQFLMADGSVKALSDITSAYVTALGTSGNYLTWTKNGAVNNITVPFATTSQKLGTATVGSGVKPMYLNAGTPTASASTVGAANHPVYLNAGTITAGTYAFDHLTAYSHYLSVSSFTTVGNDKYLCVTTPVWHSQDIVLSLRVAGSNTYADCVIHGGCRSGELWGWQTRYNNAVVTGISKDTTTSQIAFYIRLSSTVTSVAIKSSCEVTVTNADYSAKTFIAVPTSGLFGSSFTGGDIKATSLAVSGTSTLSSTLTVSGLATLNGGATIPTGKKLTIGPVTIEYDSANKGLKVSGGGLYTDSYLSALGIGNVSGSTGGGSNYDRLDSWSDYTTAKEGYVLSAKLGYSLYQDVNSLKSGAAVTVTTTGTGNAVTAISKSGTAITATKGATFLTSHQSLTHLLRVDGTNGTAAGVSELINKLSVGSSAPVDADYFISQYAGGGTTTTTYHRRPMSALWSYIKPKTDTLYQPKGNFVTLDTAQTITGVKTFSAKTIVSNYLHITSSSGNKYILIGNQDSAGANKPFIIRSANAALYFGCGNNWSDNAGGTFTQYAQINSSGITAISFIKSGGTSSQFLKADGSVDSNTYLTTGSAASTYLKLSGGSMANTNIVTNMNADLIDGVHLTSLFRKLDSNPDLDSLADGNDQNGIFYIGSSDLSVTNAPFSYGSVLNISRNAANWQLGVASTANASPYFRSRWWSGNGGTWGEWKRIAFLDSNVASATKLQTARTLWGQSFDGSANVSGNMTGVGSITASGLITNTGNLHLQSSASGAGGDVWAELWRGSNASWRFLNTSGTLKIQSNYTSAAGSYFDCMTLAYNTGNTYIRGNVGIGTTSPAYRLDVNGTARATSLRIGNATLSWDSANNALKIDGNVYATGGVSALGASGVSGDTGAGSLFGLMKSWPTSAPSSATTDALGANLGYELHTRVKSLEGGSATSITTTGSGNAITAITKSGTVITATKGATFLTAHQSLANYYTKTEVDSKFVSARPSVSGVNMNQVASYGNAMGMVSLSGTDATINPNGKTGWHHFVNISYLTQESNMWQTQIANAAGSTDLWVRSRAGGAITDGAAWSAPWVRILTESNYSSVLDSRYYTESEINTKLTNGSVTKVGTATVGSASRPVYLNAGTPTALSSTVGANNLPTYLNGGTITAVSSVGEAYLSWGGKSLSGSISPVDCAASALHSANRLAFANPAGITIEYSRDGGSTWSTYSKTDAEKINLVSGLSNALYIGGKNTDVTVSCRLRITLNATQMGVYTRARKMLINISTNGAAGTSVLVEMSKKGSETTFATVGTYPISGWSGWNSIPLGGISFGGGATQTSNAAVWRFTFFITGLSSNTSHSNALSVLDLYLIGDTYWATPQEMAKSGHLYTYDSSKNATFPAKVTAASFSGSLSGNASTATTLATARTINGTSFNGSANITTSYWGTARNISIADSTSAHTGAATSVNGSGNVTLKLPATIAATSFVGSLSGNATTATTLETARTINGTSFNGSANITTANWGTSRNIGIVNSDGTGTAVVTSVNGSAAVNLKLPATIKAALSGNATTATTLQTTRTIWGQNFNGGANVSGNMTGVGSITASGDYQTTKSNAAVKVDNTSSVLGLYNSTNRGVYDFTTNQWVVATNGTNSWMAQGNVGIGTTSPSYKLHVSGTLYASGAASLASTLSVTGNLTHSASVLPSGNNSLRVGSETLNYAGVHSRQLINNTEALMWIWQATNHEIAFATNGVERMRISAAGTVAINITSPSSGAKLHVGGNIVATGGITALSTSSTSDMRLKRVIRDITLDIRQIAGAPSFIHAWKDAAEYGGGEFAGSSAQYWLRVLPQAVSGKQWLALDYGKTALLSAIALARRSETHEQRIRRLEKENERLREQIRQIKNSIF